MTFEEIKQVKMEASDYQALKNLASNREFKVFKRIVEDYILQLTHNLIIGTESVNDSSIEELKALRGFVRYWNKLINLIKKDDKN